MTFKFDTKQAIKFLEGGVVSALLQQQLTLFAVMCINEDGASSHGGPIVACIDGELNEESANRAINETVAAALDQNEAAPDGHTCKYVPVALGMNPAMLYALTRQLYQIPLETELAYEVDDMDEDAYPEGDEG